jgi:TetR/AcrR family transcriptional regulator
MARAPPGGLTTSRFLVLLTNQLVYMPRPARVSPDRILAAAAPEFAARGYAGARVDRIARAARVNKAMIYYHFRNKQELYRALLRQTFSRAAERLQAIQASPDPPPVQLERVVAAIAAFVRDHGFFPAIMLREIAEGGARLDRDTMAALAAVPRIVGAIVQRGIDEKTFRPVHPLAAYFSMLAPIVMYLAAAPIRKRLVDGRFADGLAALTPEAFVSYIQDAMRRTLAVGAAPKARRSA